MNSGPFVFIFFINIYFFFCVFKVSILLLILLVLSKWQLVQHWLWSKCFFFFFTQLWPNLPVKVIPFHFSLEKLISPVNRQFCAPD